MKPGLKTSEFYVALAGIGTILYNFAQSHCSFTTTDVIAVAGVVIAYVGGRTWLKSKDISRK